jgi:hypothetical protein
MSQECGVKYDSDNDMDGLDAFVRLHEARNHISIPA